MSSPRSPRVPVSRTRRVSPKPGADDIPIHTETKQGTPKKITTATRPSRAAAAAEPEESAAPPHLYIVDYPNKAGEILSVAVFGDTKDFKENLKEVGAKYNAKLTNPETGQEEPGWFMTKNTPDSKKKRSEEKMKEIDQMLNNLFDLVDDINEGRVKARDPTPVKAAARAATKTTTTTRTTVRGAAVPRASPRVAATPAGYMRIVYEVEAPVKGNDLTIFQDGTDRDAVYRVKGMVKAKGSAADVADSAILEHVEGEDWGRLQLILKGGQWVVDGPGLDPATTYQISF